MCIKRDILLIFKTQPCFVITETTVMNWLNGAVVVPPLSLVILVAEIVLYRYLVRFITTLFQKLQSETILILVLLFL